MATSPPRHPQTGRFTSRAAAGPLPGDFRVVSIGGQGGALISAMEEIAYRHSTHWDHAEIYLGDGQVVRAEPGGAVVAAVGGDYQYQIWSTGILFPGPAQRTAICTAARKYADRHVGYSYLDYGAIAAHRFHLNMPGLADYIADTGHMICSQLVDQCYLDAGYHLFADGRWPGYVTPYDLGTLLERTAARLGAAAPR